MRWTFDPLRAVNAALNIDRLGAQSGTYLEDYYGEMAGINSGMASDRLLVDWDLASAPVAARGGEPLNLPLPDDVEHLAAERPDQAQALRLALRAALQAAFAEGRRIIGFDRAARVYLLAEG